MITRRVFGDRETSSSRWAPALAASCLVLLVGTPLQAQDAPLPPITVGAGVQTSFVHTDSDAEDSDSTDAFKLDNARLYVNGSVTTTIKFMFNTEYDERHEQRRRPGRGRAFRDVAEVQHLGRPFPAAERPRQPLRARSTPTTGRCTRDGVQDGYPFVSQGRDNGVVYWGEFGKVKVSAGAFDGALGHRRRTTTSSAPRASRSISGMRKAATT